MGKKTYIAMAVLCVIAIIFSAVILIEENGRKNPQPSIDVFLTGVQNLCTATKSNCETVQESVYGKTFGIENAILGIVGFGLLFILIILQLNLSLDLLHAGIVSGILIGGIMSVRFLYVQMFILKQYCIYCLIVDISSVMLLLLWMVIGTGGVGGGQKLNTVRPAKVIPPKKKISR